MDQTSRGEELDRQGRRAWRGWAMWARTYHLWGQFKRQGRGGAAAGLVEMASRGRATTGENVCGDKELEKI